MPGGKMGRQGQDGSAAVPGMRIQRSQSRLSLSASFEALAIYFPCMNSFEEADRGKNEVTYQVCFSVFKSFICQRKICL